MQIKPIPFRYYSLPSKAKSQKYTARSIAEYFVAHKLSSGSEQGIEDMNIMARSAELERDRASLIIDRIEQISRHTYENLASLYNDLLSISQMKIERPFPDYLQKDKMWLDLQKMELELKRQIRSECSQFYRLAERSVSSLQESLINLKEKQGKASMLEHILDTDAGPCKPESYMPQPYLTQPITYHPKEPYRTYRRGDYA